MDVRKRRKADGKRQKVAKEIMPTILIVPPHITTYLYKMGYKTQSDIVEIVSNLIINGK